METLAFRLCKTNIKNWILPKIFIPNPLKESIFSEYRPYHALINMKHLMRIWKIALTFCYWIAGKMIFFYHLLLSTLYFLIQGPLDWDFYSYFRKTSDKTQQQDIFKKSLPSEIYFYLVLQKTWSKFWSHMVFLSCIY